MLRLKYMMFQKGRQIRFASRLYDLYGKLFLKSPLDIMPDMHQKVREQYYYTKEDRGSGNDVRSDGITSWKASTLATAQIRDSEEIVASRAVFYTGALTCFLLLTTIYVIQPSMKAQIESSADSQIALLQEAGVEQKEKYAKELNGMEVTPAEKEARIAKYNAEMDEKVKRGIESVESSKERAIQNIGKEKQGAQSIEGEENDGAEDLYENLGGGL